MNALTQEITAKLKSVNGRRRVRTLDVSDAMWTLERALNSDLGAWGVLGGTVANCYGYPAYTTRIYAVTVGGYVALAIECVRANRGRATIPGGYRMVPKLRADIEKNPGRHIIMSVQQARALVDAYKAAEAAAA